MHAPPSDPDGPLELGRADDRLEPSQERTANQSAAEALSTRRHQPVVRLMFIECAPSHPLVLCNRSVRRRPRARAVSGVRGTTPKSSAGSRSTQATEVDPPGARPAGARRFVESGPSRSRGCHLDGQTLLCQGREPRRRRPTNRTRSRAVGVGHRAGPAITGKTPTRELPTRPRGSVTDVRSPNRRVFNHQPQPLKYRFLLVFYLTDEFGRWGF
jgi:hypothetical protein